MTWADYQRLVARLDALPASTQAAAARVEEEYVAAQGRAQVLPEEARHAREAVERETADRLRQARIALQEVHVDYLLPDSLTPVSATGGEVPADTASLLGELRRLAGRLRDHERASRERRQAEAAERERLDRERYERERRAAASAAAERAARLRRRRRWGSVLAVVTALVVLVAGVALAWVTGSEPWALVGCVLAIGAGFAVRTLVIRERPK